mmetsp:Transcript_63254/g.137596  ORF Transcript_63254/g.137596 Transcript_63254/m.137596 type:complete len:200 (+) Transcript_63254:577-1176(+)
MNAGQSALLAALRGPGWIWFSMNFTMPISSGGVGWLPSTALSSKVSWHSFASSSRRIRSSTSWRSCALRFATASVRADMRCVACREPPASDTAPHRSMSGDIALSRNSSVSCVFCSMACNMHSSGSSLAPGATSALLRSYSESSSLMERSFIGEAVPSSSQLLRSPVIVVLGLIEFRRCSRPDLDAAPSSREPSLTWGR